MFKKGSINVLFLMFILMIFSVIMISGLIVGYFIFAVGHDYAILPTYDAGITMTEEFNSSEQLVTGFENTVESYRNIDINTASDNVFIFAYVTFTITAFMVSYYSRGSGTFAFLSLITYGVILVLYVFGLFMILLNTLYYDVLQRLFTNLVVSLPVFEWWLENSGVIMLVQASILLIVRELDFDFRSFKLRKKSENLSVIDDDELI